MSPKSKKVKAKPKKATAKVAVKNRPAGPALAVETERSAGVQKHGKYVYCIIRHAGPLSFGAIGIGGDPAEVHTINYKELAAVVSDTPIEVYDPTRENVLAHERVNERVMEKHTVIP